ncbi:cell division protein FtsX [Sneathiella glossodoripedis]|uniref:cell division protein FtsX n=1 Tax=Sneathiella glossodoripedis TaxID=418853 RepID=UPI0004717526|nr:FtsX-like permease family protein [Sneathiella glossodoripedis]
MSRFFGISPELQLEKDASSRYLPVVIATMVFLASLALIGLFSINSAIGNWSAAVSGNLTVEIAHDSSIDLSAKMEKAVSVLRSIPGLENVRALSLDETAELLAPYLGRTDVIKQLPLPRLIEVTISENSAVDLLAAAKKLASEVPGAVLNTHRPWLDKMILLARSVQTIAAIIMMLISIVTVIIIVFAARTGMVMHQEIIEVLHLIGAKDSYIAKQFQNYFARLSLFGALPGLAIAILVMQVLAWLADRLEAGLISAPSMMFEGWIALAMIPVLVVILTTITVRLIVLGSLKRMM